MANVERFLSLRELGQRASRERREAEEKSGVCPECHGQGTFAAAPPHYVRADPFGPYRFGGYWVTCPRCFGTGTIEENGE